MEEEIIEEIPKKKGKKKIYLEIGIIIFIIVISTSILFIINSKSKIIPYNLRPESFEMPLDRPLTEVLNKFDESDLGKIIDIKILKKVFDNPNTMFYSMNAVEVSKDIFPEINKIKYDCSEILGIKVPKVYIISDSEINAYTTNMEDPIIVINSGLLLKYKNIEEIKFIIGHEMGHIKSKHVKFSMFIRFLQRYLPETASDVILLPFAQWQRETEMSADNAGLICVKNIKIAEFALIRAIQGTDGKINVEAYLRQKVDNMGTVSSLLFKIQQLRRTHPYIHDRIEQLRDYIDSDRYAKLWNKNASNDER